MNGVSRQTSYFELSVVNVDTTDILVRLLLVENKPSNYQNLSLKAFCSLLFNMNTIEFCVLENTNWGWCRSISTTIATMHHLIMYISLCSSDVVFSTAMYNIVCFLNEVKNEDVCLHVWLYVCMWNNPRNNHQTIGTVV